MIRPLAILALLCAPALAQTPCLTHECSDDSAVPPIAGNERVAWDRVDGARSYELSTDGTTVCALMLTCPVNSNENCALPLSVLCMEKPPVDRALMILMAQ